MNVVLYTRDMEPITVIDLPLWALEHGQRRRHVNVAVLEEPKRLSPGQPLLDGENLWVVTLEFHKMRWGDKESWLVTVDNETAALKLRPSWLPGQRAKINAYERNTRNLSRALMDVLSRGVGGH